MMEQLQGKRSVKVGDCRYDSPKGGLQWLFQTTEEGAVRNELNIQINEGGGTRVCVVERGGGMMYWGQFYNSLTLCYLNKLLLPHSQNNSLEAVCSRRCLRSSRRLSTTIIVIESAHCCGNKHVTFTTITVSQARQQSCDLSNK